ncbi:unnamed protein product [Mytilus edulis]|uniref:Mitochondria-eating protein C-terminal domain-containing protein n=1 Tax=Mytilus edulis TaxID=6550 RepID=A0A8S3R9Z3_MYTED|nr:unnamed protein product [Mytilus edulis]
MIIISSTKVHECEEILDRIWKIRKEYKLYHKSSDTQTEEEQKKNFKHHLKVLIKLEQLLKSSNLTGQSDERNVLSTDDDDDIQTTNSSKPSKEELESDQPMDTSDIKDFEVVNLENLERNQDLESQIQRLLSKNSEFEITDARLKEANDTIQTLKDENDRIQAKYKSFKDLDDRLKDSNDLIQSLTEENERISKVLKSPEEKTKKMVMSLQKKLKEEVKQKDNLSTMCDKYKSAYQKLQITNQTQEDRLSKVAGMKMKDNNPAIADLSDPNRPEKLSEKFREIYDNAWTNLLDAITEKTGESDDICVKQIVSALMVCTLEILSNKLVN